MGHLHFLNEVDSTSHWLREQVDAGKCTPGEGVAALEQTQGRGQRGNVWHSEPGKNALYSLYIQPQDLAARDQFILSQYTALTVASLLNQYAEGFSLKWPNDLYWNDQKIGGILIETQLKGNRVDEVILGIGINLNQTEFPKNLPNPVSLTQITGQTYETKAFIETLHEALTEALNDFPRYEPSEIRRHYLEGLYRKQGMHPYSDANGLFLARIKGITQLGHLVLETQEGQERTYDLKEVVFR
jgi:BirA family biotin operon repressor/biotin-[acetyl-CoA-carboxylase] ligase